MSPAEFTTFSGSTFEAYEELRASGIEFHSKGLLHEAIADLEAALKIAESLDDQDLVDRATCNWAAVAISLGQTDQSIVQLRRILMSNHSLEGSFLAAYNLARFHELTKDPRKGLFYARIARDRAADLNNPAWQYGAQNQVANALVAESHFAKAAELYQQALSLLEPFDTVTSLEGRINLGYCKLMLGNSKAGLHALYQGLRDSRRFNQPRLEMTVRLDLSFGTLEAGRPDIALRHAQRGLELAEVAGDVDAIKNALYIEGEAWTDLARLEQAERVHRSLQSRFYPNQPEVARYLLAVNSRQLINLRA